MKKNHFPVLIALVALGLSAIAGAPAANARAPSKDFKPLQLVEGQGLLSLGTASAPSAGSLQIDPTHPATSTSQNAKGTRVKVDGRQFATVTGTSKNGAPASFIVINDATAPDTYQFKIGSASTKLTVESNGSVSIRDKQGKVVDTVLAPWAKDATGKALPTSYTVSGNTLVQKVDHRGAVYPVVADPEFGCGVPWCSIYFNKTETSIIAVGGGLARAKISAACRIAPGPAALACRLATLYVTVTAGVASAQGKCVGIIGYPSPFPPSVSWNTFIYTGSQCH